LRDDDGIRWRLPDSDLVAVFGRMRPPGIDARDHRCSVEAVADAGRSVDG
jgi:hypothetical protein